MNDIDNPSNEALGQAIEDQRTGGLEVYRKDLQEAVVRHSDAVTRIEEADNEIHKLETELHDKNRDLTKWSRYREHQEKRRVAQERKIITNRDFIRATEDDDLGLD